MRTVITMHPILRKLRFRVSSHLFDFTRENHFQPKHKFVAKPVTDHKEKELLHKALLASLQKCKTVEEQIKVFYSLVKLPDENINQRYAVCKDLEKSLDPYFPSCSVHLIGSSVNGLGFKGCDVDMSILLPDESFHKQSVAKKVSLNEEAADVKNTAHKVFPSKNQLLTIRKILQDLKYDEPLAVIPGRCPILSFTARNLPCDLSVNNRLALNGTNLMLLCGKLDERVVPLMQIVIYWAKNSRLVGGHSKFKSYAIFLMVIYFLQTRTPSVLPSVEVMLEKTEFLENLENWSYDIKFYLNKFEASKNKQTIEQLLKEFFLFYGNFDFSYIICPINGTSMDRKSFASHFDCTNKFELNTICIQDPFNLEWNVTTGVNWRICKNFLKATISVWEKYQDQNIWIPGSHHWGLASLINSEFSYDNIKGIKEFSIDLSFITTSVNNNAQCNNIRFLQKAANNLKYIFNHCLLFKCNIFNEDTNINFLDFPPRVKASIENLFFKNSDVIPPKENFVTSTNTRETDLDAKVIAQYICVTQDTWSGRNTFLTYVDTPKSIFDIEHKISQKMIAERGINDKELFYFLCQCINVSENNRTYLHVRLKPLNNDRFIPKLAIFLKEYVPYLMDKFYNESND